MTIFTVGYEGMTIESFVAVLRANDVGHLVDIREVPLSRKRGFSKTALALALESAGIHYSHVKALGCPKPIRDRYRTDGDWARYARAFGLYLQSQAAALTRLRTEAKRQRCCLLCFEADAAECHRSIVARAVVGSARRSIIHLSASGAVTEDSAAVA